jgi:hypothetical protein
MKRVFTLLVLASFVFGASAQKRNMIANSRFEDGYLNWFAEGSSLDTLGDIKYDVDSILPISGKKSAKITIKRDPSNFWDRSFGYVVPITAGSNYQIRVKVRATGTTKLNIEFGQNHSSWDFAYAKGDNVVGETVSEIVINTNGNAIGTATTKSDFNFVFKFDLGDQPNGAVIWIDDISLTQLSGNWDGNLVPLGDFEEVSAGWNSYFDMWGIGTCADISIDENNMISGKSLHITKTSTNTDWKATDLEFFYKQNKLADYEISFDILAANGSTLGAQLFKSYMSNMNGSHEEAACLLAKNITSTKTDQVEHFVINKTNTDSATYRQRGLNSTWDGIVKVYSGFGADVMPVGYNVYLDNIKVKEVITLKSLEIVGDSIVTKDTTLGLWAAPTHADNSVIWSVTNGTGTATIDTVGNIHPVSNGTITVTATSKVDGSVVASKAFSVVMPGDAIPVASSSILRVYPNPVKNALFIDVNDITDISIMSIEGVMMQKHNVSENVVDMSQLPSGFYLVKISTTSGNYVKSVLKQ